jgi:hypothetical protein
LPLPAREPSQLDLPGVLVLLVVYDLFDYALPPALFPPVTVMGRKKTADELDARAKANNYKRGAHWEEDSRREHNKYSMDGTIKDQDGVLDRYIL